MRWTIAATLVAFAGFASAQSLFDADDVSSNFIDTVTLERTGLSGKDVTVKLDGDKIDVRAGVFTFNVDGVKDKFLCVELDQFAPKTGDEVDYKFYAPEGVMGQLANLIAGADTKDKKAGLQLAAWEVAYDLSAGNSLDITSGKFMVHTASSGAKAYAKTVLEGLDLNQKEGYYYYGNGHRQDYVAAVPEPGTLLVLGLGSLVALRRRKKTA